MKGGRFVPGTAAGYKPFAEGDGTEFTPEIISVTDSHSGEVSLKNTLDTTSVQAEKERCV